MNSANDDNQIKASVEDLGNGRYEVKTWYGADTYEDSKHKSIKTTPESNSSNPGGGNTTPPTEDESLDFLDDPSKLPERIVPVGNCTPETEREKAGIFLDEAMRRGELFVQWYENQYAESGDVDGHELYKWQTALSIEFRDSDCGTFTIASQTTNSEGEAFFHFGIVLNPNGGGYYTMADDGSINEVQEYIDIFDLEEF